MGTITQVFGSRTPFGSVSRINSLVNGHAVALGAVDLSSTTADGVKIEVSITLGSGVSGSGTIVIYLAESLDGGTTFEDVIDPTSSADQSSLIKNLRPVKTCNAITNGQLVHVIFDLPCQICPQRFTLVVMNNSGATLAASPNDVEYMTVTYSD